MKKIIILLSAVFVLLGLPIRVSAAYGTISLANKKTYSSYDVTGDGKSDKVRVVYTTSYPKEARIYINGVKKGTFDLMRGGEVFLCRMTKRKAVFCISGYGFGFNVANFYMYSGGKLVSVDGSAYKNRVYFDYLTPKSGSSSYLTVKVRSGKHSWIFDHEKTTGYSVSMKLKFSKGKLVPIANYFKRSKSFKASMPFYTSSSPTTQNSKGVHVLAGDKVIVKGAYFGKSDVMLKISVAGKTGWVSDGGYDAKGNYISGALTS